MSFVKIIKVNRYGPRLSVDVNNNLIMKVNEETDITIPLARIVITCTEEVKLVVSGNDARKGCRWVAASFIRMAYETHKMKF